MIKGLYCIAENKIVTNGQILSKVLAKKKIYDILYKPNTLGGVLDSLGGAMARVACRDPAGSLNSGTNLIDNNNYALAA